MLTSLKNICSYIYLNEEENDLNYIIVVYSTIEAMGKKVKNAKLLKGGQSKPTMLSMFNQYANKLADSHKKKI